MTERHGASHRITQTRPGSGNSTDIPRSSRPLPGSAGGWGTRNQNPVKAEGSAEWKKRLKREDKDEN